MGWWYSVKFGRIEAYVERSMVNAHQPWLYGGTERDRWGVSLRCKIGRTSLIITRKH